MSNLNMPYGGSLTELILPKERAKALRAEARKFSSWDLTPRQLCDLELLLNGGFSPLTGFLGRADYEAVVAEMRLADGRIWPLPITLDVTEAFARGLSVGERIALRDEEGVVLAVLTVEDRWQPDKTREAREVFGTTSLEHPGVDFLLHGAHPFCLGGTLEGLELPRHHDFVSRRHTPQELRARFEKMGWRRVIAFQTRNPMHRGHVEITFRAAKEAEANLLIHPVVGLTKPGDVDPYSRVRCYEHVLGRYPRQTTDLSLLPLAMRMAGPREALLHGIVRKNYGCSHFIVGRDHAGLGKDSKGQDFYGPYEAQELMERYQEELGIEMVPFKMMAFVEERGAYLPLGEVREGEMVSLISGTDFRKRLQAGSPIPEWFSFPEVVAELRRTIPPLSQQGFTVFFTGLSGAGKSTIAKALACKLQEIGGRALTLLDGDIVRKNLSSELGFSKEHRDINIRRIGFVASEITKNGGIAICASIAPYRRTRAEVREAISKNGGFIEIYVSTPLEVCETRDRKGLYAKARAGLIEAFTGISDPYETPESAELVIDTVDCSPDEAAGRILLFLEKEGYLG